MCFCFFFSILDVGVSLDVYRSRIGLFSGGSRNCTLHFHSLHSLGIVLRHIPVVCLCILLLASGIESNPGPRTYPCSFCKLKFSQAKSYFSHHSIHQSVKNFGIPCVYPDCHSRLKTFASLQFHLQHKHSQRAESAVVPGSATFKCPIPSCNETILSKKILRVHMSGHLNDGKTFLCPYEGCNSTMRKAATFSSHLSRKHKFEGLPNEKVHNHEPEDIEMNIENVPSSSRTDDNIGLDFQTEYHSVGIDTEANSELFPDSVIKEEVARFYLRLEGNLFIPSSTVQIISEEIALMSRLSHHSLKRSLIKEMLSMGIAEDVTKSIISKGFKGDTVFNIHHKHEDIEQLTSIHLRKKFIQKHFPLVIPEEIPLGKNKSGKKTSAHHVSIRETINVLKKDPKLKEKITKSFSRSKRSDGVLTDFFDGTAFEKHCETHDGVKCLPLILFQDAFEFCPFGTGKGLYKSVGFYYTLGSLPAEDRSKLDLIQLAYLIREQDLQTLDDDYLNGVDNYRRALNPLLDELIDLRTNGIEIDGERVLVCVLFCVGDNLGAHQIASFVQNFSTSPYCCRFCPISKQEFHDQPDVCRTLRTPQQYDECTELAKQKWLSYKRKAILHQKRLLLKKRREGQLITSALQVTKSALKRLRAINHLGVKPTPSPLNIIPGVHVCSPCLPVCIAHDLNEGLISDIVPEALRYFIETNKWFTLEELNQHIVSFKYEGTDAADTCRPLKKFDRLPNNAAGNLNFLKLLPLMIGDLIKDKQDDRWTLLLQLKQICEFLYAPQISYTQVAYLKVLIQEYLLAVKGLYPSFLTWKHHYLAHYPDLIDIFGPLTKMFSLRFESKHMFFKRVAKFCSCFKNITKTLAEKHMLKFAFDHSNHKILPDDVSYEISKSSHLPVHELPAGMKAAFGNTHVQDFRSLPSVTIKGITYRKGLWFILDKEESVDLKVGCIEIILNDSSDNISFLLKEARAENTFQGYYEIMEYRERQHWCISTLSELPDWTALSSYSYHGRKCLVLKHSVLCM